ncbi:MAG: DUF2892 domain-containing protein [Leptospirales bacterium]|nr:DUF2892 domain-containing protein [Leptospirales bacterium]
MYRLQTDFWYLERAIWLVAGLFTLASVGLGYFVSPYWLILTGLVGTNLLILALTGFCPMTALLRLLGLRSAFEKRP